MKENLLKKTVYILCVSLLVASMTACAQQSTKSGSYIPKEDLLSEDPVTLKLTGTSESFKAMENVISSFAGLYPNCSIEYEYVQDYENSVTTRLSNNDDIDLFITNNITSSSPYLPFALELSGQSDALDLSGAYEGLLRNFTIAGDNGGMYAIPLGGEVRGMYVNTTLLKKLGLSVPQNYEELLDCCAKLKDAGYIPMQGNPGYFGQILMYPYICSLIANADDYETVYDEVNSCADGVSELFREPFARLYNIVENGYYNYKYAETNDNLFLESSNEVTARSFLDLTEDANGNVQKKEDVGQVAFMPQTMSFQNYLDKIKEDYHSTIEYEFILAPVGDDGGYAYLSPAEGIAVNKNSDNVKWALEFLNYLFSKDVNQTFAKEQCIIPNTADALDAINADFQVDEAHICQLGQVTFDYVFYDVMKTSLTDVSKANNPKYMKEDGTMYDLDYYMDGLEASFAENRK